MIQEGNLKKALWASVMGGSLRGRRLKSQRALATGCISKLRTKRRSLIHVTNISYPCKIHPFPCNTFLIVLVIVSFLFFVCFFLDGLVCSLKIFEIGDRACHESYFEKSSFAEAHSLIFPLPPQKGQLDQFVESS